MNTHYSNNIKAVMQVNKAYTDTEIKKSEEKILWHIGEYQTTTQDDNTTAYQKIVPANATRCKIKRIYGNSVKYAPTTASDTTSAYQKNVPSYSPSIDRASANINTLGGMSYKCSNMYSGNQTLVVSANDSASSGVMSDLTLVSGETYTLSFTNSNANGYIRVWINTLQNLGDYQGSSSITFTANQTFTNVQFVFYDQNGENQTFTNIMLNSGSTALPYEPYYSGFRDTAPTSVKSVGFNIWDEQKEYGGYDQNTGAKTSSSITYRNVNPIAVFPSTTYYIKKKNDDAGFVYYYDSNMNYISASYKNTSTTFTTPSNCYFINFTSMASTWENETCINISDVSLNGTYKPYFSDTLAIDSNIQALDGYGKSIVGTNVSNTLDFNSKKFIKYRGDVDLGTLGWVKDTTTRPADGATINAWYAQLDECKLNADYYANMFLDGYTVETVNNVDYGGYSVIKDKLIGGTDNNHRIWLYNSAYQNMTQQELQAELSGKILQFELATPVETDISAYLTTNEIEIEPNGTLSFESTYNAYVPSDVSYNGVIKHALATAIQQSRNGVVIKTINLPYQASDGWSVGSVRNVRDFTISKRGTNISNKNLGDTNWYYYDGAGSDHLSMRTNDLQSSIKPSANNTPANILCSKLSTTSGDTVWEELVDGCIAVDVIGVVLCYSSNMGYNPTIFKSAMNGNPLFYELDDEHKTESDITAIDNILVVEEGDTLTFVNSEGLPVPSDLTYRIEVARV